jgi:antirestriction protein ArdC
MNPNDIRQQVTQRIVQALESGTVPWRRPWRVSPNASGRPRNIASRKAYSGVNPLLLALHGLQHGLQSRWFGTFQQWQALGCTVKRRPESVKPGQWGCPIVFYKPITKLLTNHETGEKEEDTFRLLRTYTVFCADQVEGEAAEKFKGLEEAAEMCALVLPDFEPADRFIAATKADIRIMGEEAFYRRPTPENSWPQHTGGDFIQVPQRQKFLQPGAWYETVFHEIGHWSEVRLGFDHGKNSYALGELRAEMAACFLSAELGIPQGEDLTNHAAYLKSWLGAMKADPSFIFKASSQASKVCDFLLAFVRQEQSQAA